MVIYDKMTIYGNEWQYIATYFNILQYILAGAMNGGVLAIYAAMLQFYLHSMQISIWLEQ